jgi:oligosaccharyltransferase complex subunit epsilon
MAPKQRTTAQPPTIPGTPAKSTPSATPKPTTSSSKSSGNPYDAQDIALGIWNKYVEKTPQRVKLLDSFMAFLAVVGALQFLYVVIVGNFVRSHAPCLGVIHGEVHTDDFRTMC